jgi:hypothetical protein
MMDYVSTPAWAQGLAPTVSREEGHAEATMARPPKASPPPTTDGVDKMYHQLVEIHANATAQLAECIRCVDLTQPLTRLTPALVREDPPQSPPWQGRLHHHQWISLPKPRCGSEAHALSPRLLANPPGGQARNPHHGEHKSQRRHSCDSKGPGVETPRSGTRDVPLILPFQAPVDTIRNTTEELRSVTAQYATSNKADQLRPTPSNSGEASFEVTI